VRVLAALIALAPLALAGCASLTTLTSLISDGAPTRHAFAEGQRAKADALERDGNLRAALDATNVALTVAPGDPALREGKGRLQARIEQGVTEQTNAARTALSRKAYLEARRHFLAVLALDPANATAFNGLREDVKEVRFVTHTVRTGDSLGSIAQRYYGDRSRSEVIWEMNNLPRNPRLAVGASLRVPEIPGVPFLLTPREGGPGDPRTSVTPRDDIAPQVDPLLADARDSLERKAFNEALADIDRVLASNPRNAEATELRKSALYSLGKTRLGEKKYDESYQALNQLAKLAPRYEDAPELTRQARSGLVQQRYNEGLRLYREEKVEQAIVQWKAVLELDPRNANARKNIEQAETILRKLDERTKR
jgi:tetratricopeptide (TPR) repeat protein